MNTMSPPKSRKPFSARGRKLGALCSAVTLTALLGFSPAFAQQTTTADKAAAEKAAADKAAIKKAAAEKAVVLEAYVVTGIRASMTKALDIKRTSLNLVDAIVAEDIGKFPDNNVVEALQRVPGIQVTDRGRGQVSTVTIRGLNDVSTTINGRNLFTASGLSVSLPDIPASLLSQVTVFKTRSADLIETGIAGQIDIKTHRPFDFTSDKIVLAARGIYADLPAKTAPNLSALFSKTWDTKNGKVGALFNVSYSETPYRNEAVNPGAEVPFMTNTPAAGRVPYQRIFTNGTSPWQAGITDGLPTAPGSTMLINGVATPYVLSRDAVFQNDENGKTKRPAANLSLQWAPDKDTEYTLEAFYDGYRNQNFNSLLFSFVDWWGGPLGAVTLYPNTNIVQSRASVANVYTFNSGDMTTGKTDSYIVALGGKWNISPDLKLKSDLSVQSSEFNQNFFAVRIDRVAPAVSVNFNTGNGMPSMSFPGSNLTDPSLWNIAQMYNNINKNKGRAATFTMDGDYTTQWNFMQKLRFGIRYDDRKASQGSNTQGGDPGLGQNLAKYPQLVSTNSGFLEGRADVPTAWVVPNGYYIISHQDEIINLYKSTVKPSLLNTAQYKTIERFNVDEVNATAYLMGNFDTYIAGHKLDGQVGARYVHVKTDMAFSGNTGSASAAKLLPSAALRYAITDKLKLRFAYGETLRRPNFTDLNPTITYVRDVTNIGYGTASGGNSNLKPTHAKNYDLALEYYLDDATAIFATAFQRNIDGLVVGFRKRVTYTDAIGPYDYILSQPDNASNGKLHGIEIGGSYFPKNLPDVLNGLGVSASYTKLSSSQDIPITDGTGKVIGTQNTPFFAVSDSSYSVVLAYEKKKFSARFSHEWRSSFLNNYEAALFANPLGVYRKPEQSTDLALTYKVTDNLTVTLDGTNLTKELYQSYYGNKPGNSTTNNFRTNLYARAYALGVRYAF